MKLKFAKQPNRISRRLLFFCASLLFISLPASGFAASPAQAASNSISPAVYFFASGCNYSSGCDLISNYVNPSITLLSILFGLIAAASLISGGIQYTASEGDPQKASKAKSRMVNTVFAILAYAVLYGFLQFLVPGGVFNR